MAYMVSHETFNTVLLFMGILFASNIACEWIKDDMKYLYQGVALLIDAALGLIMGWELFTENVWLGGIGSMQFPPLGFVIAGFGALCFVLFVFKWLPMVVKPYEKAGGDYPLSPRSPKKPMQPGG